MSSIVEQKFNEIIREARTNEIKYYEVLFGKLYECIFRMGFNVVENGVVSDSLFNLYINDYKDLIKKLEEYVYIAINLYQFDMNEYDIKKILILLWANITNEEMLDVNSFVQKYIDFFNNNALVGYHGEKTIDGIGKLSYSFDIQSYKQETPYCFNSCFSNLINGQEVIYHLPRISYGIIGDKCYIYAIQNKNKKSNNPEQLVYDEIVKKKMNTINSGVKTYRNVTPSALIAIILFLSILQEKNINKIEVVCNLPIRHQNRRLVNEFKLQVENQEKSVVDIEKIQSIMKSKSVQIYNNTVIKYKDSFKRIANQFGVIMRLPENELSENLFLSVNILDTENAFIKQIIASNIEKRI